MRGTLLLFSCTVLVSGAAFGQYSGSDILRQEMTTYLQADIGSSTYESDAAQSKQTAATDTFTFGASAGYNRLVGFQLSSNRNDVKFALNNSTMMSHWTDMAISYRLGWFYPSIVGSLAEIKIDRANGDYVDIYRGTVGAGLAFKVPLWNKIVAFADTRYLQRPEVPKLSNIQIRSADATPEGTPRQLDGSLGARSDLDIGASIDISREFLDFIVGYRARKYQLVIEEENENELQAGPYAGLRLGAYF